MAGFEYIDFVPPWARGRPVGATDHEDTPILGFEPWYAPRLPTRVVPNNDDDSLSSLTLSEIVATTQKILNFVTYEYIHGVKYEFSDSRSIDSPVLELAKLHIHSFEEGSFVIPGFLTEEPIQIDVNGATRSFNSQGVLKRFADVMDGIVAQGAVFPTCLGVLQSIEELGKVLKREARSIEYKPIGFSGYSHTTKNILINSDFIDKVSASRKQRQNPKSSQEILTGNLEAVNLAKSTFILKLSKRQKVRGTFTPFMEDRIIRGLGRSVEIDGIIEYKNDKAQFIKAIDIRLLDDE